MIALKLVSCDEHSAANPLVSGGPNDGADTRHAGDLGNLQSDASGNCHVEIEDKVLTLHGPLSIIGRSVIMSAPRVV